jgi:hypothetical protein
MKLYAVFVKSTNQFVCDIYADSRANALGKLSQILIQVKSGLSIGAFDVVLQ